MIIVAAVSWGVLIIVGLALACLFAHRMVRHEAEADDTGCQTGVGEGSSEISRGTHGINSQGARASWLEGKINGSHTKDVADVSCQGGRKSQAGIEASAPR